MGIHTNNLLDCMSVHTASQSFLSLSDFCSKAVNFKNTYKISERVIKFTEIILSWPSSCHLSSKVGCQWELNRGKKKTPKPKQPPPQNWKTLPLPKRADLAYLLSQKDSKGRGYLLEPRDNKDFQPFSVPHYLQFGLFPQELDLAWTSWN